MHAARCFLYFFLFQLLSCTSIPFRQAPPRDVQSLKTFPEQLWGEYYLHDAKNVNGESWFKQNLECQKKLNTFEIYRDSLVYHDYRTTAYKKIPRDSAIVEVNDSLITVNDFEGIKKYPYINCGQEYVAIFRDQGSTLVLCDTIQLKQVGMYYFLSIQLKELWFSLVFKNPEPGKLQWLTAMLQKDQKKLEARIKAITPAVPAVFDGKNTFCFDPDKKQMLQMIQTGIYQLTMEFLRK